MPDFWRSCAVAAFFVSGIEVNIEMKKTIVITLTLLMLASVQAFGWMTFRLEDPIQGLLSNSVTQIIYDGEYVWLATGNGLAGSNDGGISWITYNKDNAFAASGISALALAGNRLLIATADIDINGMGSGLYYTDDNGQSFNAVDNPLFSRLGKLSYDLSVFDSVAYSTNFNAGLLRSLDGGLSWENIFIDARLDSVFQKDSTFIQSGYERGRYFSTVIDPYHDDTTIVWAGSAEGVQRLYYIGKHKKLASTRVNDIGNDGHDWWYATDRGVSYFNDTVQIFYTYDTDNGFPFNFVSSIAVKGDLVLAGLYDTLTSSSMGFAVSTNAGASWTLENPAVAIGANRKIEDIKFHGNTAYAACDQGGLLRSTDNGQTWTQYYPFDGHAFGERTRTVHAIDVAEREDFSRMTVGTDSGVVAIYYSEAGDLDSTVHMRIFDNPTYGQKVISLSTFKTFFGEEYWACVQPYKINVGSQPAVLRSIDHGFTWDHHLVGPPALISNQIEIGEMYGDTVVWVATDQGIRITTNLGIRWDVATALDILTGQGINSDAKQLCVYMSDTETHFGSAANGVAQHYLGIIGDIARFNYRIYRPNLDPNEFDFVGRSYTATGVVPGDSALAGNFVVAMALQRTGDSSLIWAAVRPALESGGRNGISFTADRGLSWKFTLNNTQVWNFEFNGDTAFAASSQGLYMTTDFGENWEQISINDPVTGRSISDSTEVYAITLIGNEYWVGTDDGIAKSTNLEDWTIIRTFVEIPVNAEDDERSFVTPNPFSPYLASREMKFHYLLKQPGDVTITIYDFANNVVRKVLDGAPRQGNLQYDDLDTWDGKNSQGDEVAAGVYFYLLESTGGDKLWGKFMVIP